MKRKTPDGFTLVELLATIAIIGVLSGILIVVIGRARDKAKSTQCLSNLRQITLAMIAYTGENKGRLPAQQTTVDGQPFTWRARLLPYLGDNKSMEVFLCPADDIGRASISPPYDMAYITRTGVMPASYGPAVVWYYISSGTLPYPGAYTGEYRINTIAKPASTLFVTDTGRPANISLPPEQWTETSRFPTTQFSESVMPSVYYSNAWTAYPRHGGDKVNSAFFDGHAAVVSIQELRDNTPGNPNCLYWPYR
ncbi:DUF1559 domain-containing protein [Rariglobus hedericola]|uniref:Type II secretion system protein n=1 Tax=Rariglobus hedericola TaxID=2597822 RepID=A0A556QPH4_9BACT|nr:type II secretion system protein [Rariglobus hedericola]TSJ78544.1 type II secretion system protein [Rariglobus hedericola]